MPADPRAVLTRPAPEPDRTVAYGDHPDQVADLRLPAGNGPARPLVVVVHGGFWRAEYDRRHTGPLAAALAGSGYPVAQLEYRRTGQPGGGWPGTLTDVLTGVAELPGLAADLMPDRVTRAAPILVGHSAGGHLALYAAAVAPTTVGGSSPWPRWPTSPRRTGGIWTRARWPRCSAAVRRRFRTGTRRQIHDHWCRHRHGQ
ncbi:hypothetical protein GCM10027614_49950 [Micromonospora vulcania]